MRAEGEYILCAANHYDDYHEHPNQPINTADAIRCFEECAKFINQFPDRKI